MSLSVCRSKHKLSTLDKQYFFIMVHWDSLLQTSLQLFLAAMQNVHWVLWFKVWLKWYVLFMLLFHLDHKGFYITLILKILSKFSKSMCPIYVVIKCISNIGNIAYLYQLDPQVSFYYLFGLFYLFFFYFILPVGTRFNAFMLLQSNPKILLFRLSAM